MTNFLQKLTPRVLAFWNDEQGQDLIEYTLLMAFVALASAALFIGAGGSISSIWTTTNTQLSTAAATASS
jgi:Flp pilus assembly pilin Flp